jgi:hemolysin D
MSEQSKSTKPASRLAEILAGLKRHIEIWRISWEEAKREQPMRRPQGKELAFLPAVIEVQDTPPSPAGRTVMWIIIVLFTAAILWASFGKIDIIAVAQGKIAHSGGSQVIQPLESGVIKAIHVRDGQRVKKGDPLIEIDTTAGADRERFANEYLAALTEAARVRALIAGRDTFVAPKGADPAYVRNQLNRLRDQLAELRALEAQAEALKKLEAQQYVSRMQYLDAEQKRAAKAQEHAAALADAETRAHSLSKETAKAQTRASQQFLAAPIDGVVQQLAVHTVGGVVTPAQQLMVIGSHEGSVEIEAWVENKDIGFVNEAQEAEIKVEAFPFTRYGTIPGRVVSLSKDAVPLEKQGFFYGARVSVDRSTIRVENDKDVPLTPGMNVSVEIKTGKRRLIEYFLSPLVQAMHSSVRER